MVRLRERAEAQAMHFQAAVREEAKDLPRSQKGRLSVRIRDQRAERATPGAFTIEWVKIRTATAGRRVSCACRITCQRARATVTRRPPFATSGSTGNVPWSTATEDAFAQIRRGVRLVAQTRAQYRAAEKHLVELFARPTH